MNPRYYYPWTANVLFYFRIKKYRIKFCRKKLNCILKDINIKHKYNKNPSRNGLGFLLFFYDLNLGPFDYKCFFRFSKLLAYFVFRDFIMHFTLVCSPIITFFHKTLRKQTRGSSAKPNLARFYLGCRIKLYFNFI